MRCAELFRLLSFLFLRRHVLHGPRGACTRRRWVRKGADVVDPRKWEVGCPFTSFFFFLCVVKLSVERVRCGFTGGEDLAAGVSSALHFFGCCCPPLFAQTRTSRKKGCLHSLLPGAEGS